MCCIIVCHDYICAWRFTVKLCALKFSLSFILDLSWLSQDKITDWYGLDQIRTQHTKEHRLVRTGPNQNKQHSTQTIKDWSGLDQIRTDSTAHKRSQTGPEWTKSEHTAQHTKDHRLVRTGPNQNTQHSTQKQSTSNTGRERSDETKQDKKTRCQGAQTIGDYGGSIWAERKRKKEKRKKKSEKNSRL